MTKSKYIPEQPVGISLARLTLDGETSAIIEAWKRQGFNKTTMLIMCAWYAINAETELVTDYDRSGFENYGVNTPRPLLVRIDSAAKFYNMNRSEFWDACVRTTVRDAKAGVQVSLSAMIPTPVTVEEMQEAINKKNK